MQRSKDRSVGTVPEPFAPGVVGRSCCTEKGRVVARGPGAMQQGPTASAQLGLAVSCERGGGDQGATVLVNLELFSCRIMKV